MSSARKSVVILIAEDDEDDRMLAKDALEESRLCNDLYFVGDGVELLEYLRHEGRFADPAAAPRPGVVLLDLNMPRKDGREALAEMKQDPVLRRVPVVVMTTSREEEDILKSYDMGAAGFITKPITFAGLVEVMRSLGKYWMEIVELPRDGS